MGHIRFCIVTAAPRAANVLMICSGNICRSPLAECILRHKAARRGVKGDRLHIDSAGVGNWHVGDPPDPRACAVGTRHGVRMTGAARQIKPHDLRRFDMLVCMDQTHRDHLHSLGADPSKVRLLLEFDPRASQTDVPDPYEGGEAEFEEVFHLIDAACDHLLDHLLDGASERK